MKAGMKGRFFAAASPFRDARSPVVGAIGPKQNRSPTTARLLKDAFGDVVRSWLAVDRDGASPGGRECQVHL